MKELDVRAIMRGLLAFMLVGTFCGIFFGVAPIADEPYFTALVGIVGGVIGFYFGEQSGRNGGTKPE